MAYATGSDGFPLWYDAAGEGTAIVLPSRSAGEHEALGAALIEVGHRVIRYVPRDMPGADPSWDTADLAEYPTRLAIADLHAVADAGGIDGFTLAGYSGTGALAAFLAPASPRATGLAVGGFPVLGPHDYWLGMLEGTSSALTGAGLTEQADLAWPGILMYREWLTRDDRAALRDMPGPKVVWFGSADGEPGCATYDIMRGSTVARRVHAQAGELRGLGFDIVEVSGYDHLGTQNAVALVAGRLGASFAAQGDAGFPIHRPATGTRSTRTSSVAKAAAGGAARAAAAPGTAPAPGAKARSKSRRRRSSRH